MNPDFLQPFGTETPFLPLIARKGPNTPTPASDPDVEPGENEEEIDDEDLEELDEEEIEEVDEEDMEDEDEDEEEAADETA